MASREETAALWHLGLLTGDDVAAICLRWLTENIDGGNVDIACLAGQRGLEVSTIRSDFERGLRAVVGREIIGDEALLRSLHLHLRWAEADGDIVDRVGSLLRRFVGLFEKRLVHNPCRANDNPNERYAAEELGLEYIYGGYYAFDDLVGLNEADRFTAEADLRAQLRVAVATLRLHLTELFVD
jgi:hypothetical protein